MEFITQFFNEYGTTILYGILTAIAGALAVWVKKIYTDFINTKTKEKIVKICVNAVEQMYKDLHGEEKYNKVVESVVEMLEEKGITITELELKMLIEATVGEFNEAFRNTDVVASE
jgi:hypothetical protein